MTTDETKELEELRAAVARLTTRIIRLKLERDAVMKELDKANPQKALELSRKFQRESAS